MSIMSFAKRISAMSHKIHALILVFAFGASFAGMNAYLQATKPSHADMVQAQQLVSNPRVQEWKKNEHSPKASVTLNILHVFTPSALKYVPHHGKNVTQQDLDDFSTRLIVSENAALIESDVRLRVRVASSIIEKNAPYSTNGNTYLKNFGNPDKFPMTNAERHRTNADIAVLFAGDLKNVGGLANYSTNTTAHGALAIMAARLVSAGQVQTYGHELGHTLGLQHDPATIKKYDHHDSHGSNVGYVDPSGRVRDLMSYDTACTPAPGTTTKACQVVPAYSSPKVTGVVFDEVAGRTVSHNIPLGDAQHNAAGYLNDHLTNYAAMNFNAGN